MSTTPMSHLSKSLPLILRLTMPAGKKETLIERDKAKPKRGPKTRRAILQQQRKPKEPTEWQQKHQFMIAEVMLQELCAAKQRKHQTRILIEYVQPSFEEFFKNLEQEWAKRS
jgi:hypothetical protein